MLFAVLEEILNGAKSKRFADVYSKLMNDYKSFSIGSDDYKKAITKRMNVRNKIYNVISRDYGKNNIAGTAGFGGFKKVTVRTVTGDINVKFGGQR